jgi:hypothetical protein
VKKVQWSAPQSIPISNQIISWLKDMESLRKLLPEVSGLALVIGNWVRNDHPIIDWNHPSRSGNRDLCAERRGTFTITKAFQNINGFVSPGSPVTGTYTVFLDCTKRPDFFRKRRVSFVRGTKATPRWYYSFTLETSIQTPTSIFLEDEVLAPASMALATKLGGMIMIKQAKVLFTIFWVLAVVTNLYAADFPQGTYTSGEYTIVFSDKGQFRVSTGEELVVEGEYTVKGEQLILTDKRGRLACTGEGMETATYAWKFEGETLTLSKVEDKCPGRSSGLTGGPWKRKKWTSSHRFREPL